MSDRGGRVSGPPAIQCMPRNRDNVGCHYGQIVGVVEADLLNSGGRRAHVPELLQPVSYDAAGPDRYTRPAAGGGAVTKRPSVDAVAAASQGAERENRE